jgi:ATP-dependent Lon protease
MDPIQSRHAFNALAASAQKISRQKSSHPQVQAESMATPSFKGALPGIAYKAAFMGSQTNQTSIRFGNNDGREKVGSILIPTAADTAYLNSLSTDGNLLTQPNSPFALDIAYANALQKASLQIKATIQKAEAIQKELNSPMLVPQHAMIAATRAAMKELEQMGDYYPNRLDPVSAGIGQTRALGHILNGDEDRQPILQGFFKEALYRKEKHRQPFVYIEQPVPQGNTISSMDVYNNIEIPSRVCYERTQMTAPQLYQLLQQLGKQLERDVTRNVNAETPENLDTLHQTLKQGLIEMVAQKGTKGYTADFINVLKEKQTASQGSSNLKEILKNIQIEAQAIADFQLDNPAKMMDKLNELAMEGHMPIQVKTQIRNEISRLQGQNNKDPDYEINRTWVDRALSLPWVKTPPKPIDLQEAKAILDRDHYDMEKVKRQILRFLATMKQNPTSKPKYLLFVGPPGVGKTSITKAIAEVLGRNYARISADGVTDEHEIKGHRKTYIGAMPGMIMDAMKRAGSANPVIVIDEVDKLGAGGDPKTQAAKQALISTLDPEQNKEYTDLYYNFPYDMNDVFFVLTANYEEQIPPALKDRVEVVRLERYDDNTKLEIAERHLLPQVLKQQGLTKDQVEIPRDVLEKVVQRYTREAGVRNLKRKINTLAEGATWERQISADPKAHPKITITPEMVEEEGYLGHPVFDVPKTIPGDMTGEVNGLGYTDYGGDTLPVQVNARPAKEFRIAQITGNLEKVMSESPKYVVSHLSSIAETLKLKDEFKHGADIDVHCPAAATPKDGPSAGVTITTAIVSELTGIKARKDVAMTGEVDSKGRVLPIGGVKEKVDAAYRAGIKLVLLPEENRKDISKVPEYQRKAVELLPVKTIKEVLEKALEANPFYNSESPKAQPGRKIGFQPIISHPPSTPHEKTHAV